VPTRKLFDQLLIGCRPQRPTVRLAIFSSNFAFSIRGSPAEGYRPVRPRTLTRVNIGASIAQLIIGITQADDLPNLMRRGFWIGCAS
jgi:hypothetical protein